MNNRTKATNISKQTHKEVLERDGCCILCGDYNWLETHHFVLKSQGGLGQRFNLVMLCKQCHNLAHSKHKKEINLHIEKYLRNIYPQWNISQCKYNKWRPAVNTPKNLQRRN